MLKREATNSYDPLAIAVYTTGGSKLGYLPRYMNEIPATLMDQGCPLIAQISVIAPKAPSWEKVALELRFNA
ncbi:MAG: hypothetical protein GX087_12945 [Desulfobulbaceae bacterium]|nr:hypothetical protein [Desulfobulbaceae bacterium]